jgi:hypothetical protein
MGWQKVSLHGAGGAVNPQIEHENLLRQHKFELVSDRNHLKYNDPHGRVYIAAKTPSDWRVWHNAIRSLKGVIRRPVPTSAVVDEERQRKELEQFIALHPVIKKSVVGIQGAGKGKKAKGIGIFYEEKPDKTAEQIALEEQQREQARANDEQKAAEKKARRTERRQRDAANRRQRELDRDWTDAINIGIAISEVGNVRRAAASAIRKARKFAPREELVPYPAYRQGSADIHRRLFNQTNSFLIKGIGKTAQEIVNEERRDEKGMSRFERFGSVLMFLGKRDQDQFTFTEEEVPTIQQHAEAFIDSVLGKTAHSRRILRLVTQHRKDWIGEVLAKELVRLKAKVEADNAAEKESSVKESASNEIGEVVTV